MKNNKIVGSIICIIMMLLTVFTSCSSSGDHTKVTSSKASDIAITTTLPLIGLVSTTSWEESITHSPEEQEFYNSLEPEERKVYDRVWNDDNFRINSNQSYNKTVEKQKNVQILSSNFTLDYCYSFTRKGVYDQNPDSINTNSTLDIYIDQNKNKYMFDLQGNFRQYSAYYAPNYIEECKKNKITMEEALEKIGSFSESWISEINNLSLVEKRDNGNKYSFNFKKKLSVFFMESIIIDVFYDGKIESISYYVYSDKQQISKEKEKAVLDRLDDFIKSNYGDKIITYDFGTDVRCKKLDYDYVAEFSVVFKEEDDVSFVERIVIKIE